MLFASEGDGDGIFAEKVMVQGFSVDEGTVGLNKVGGEEDVCAEGGEEGVEVWGGGWGKGREGAYVRLF